jgi:hypothetical protein
MRCQTHGIAQLLVDCGFGQCLVANVDASKVLQKVDQRAFQIQELIGFGCVVSLLYIESNTIQEGWNHANNTGRHCIALHCIPNEYHAIEATGNLAKPIQHRTCHDL